MNTSVEEPEETIAHTKGRNNINDIKPESKKRQRSKALSSECVERSRQDEREEEVENSFGGRGVQDDELGRVEGCL